MYYHQSSLVCCLTNICREETEESLARSNYEHESKVFSLSQNSHEMIQSCKDNTRFQYSKTVDRKKMEYKYMKKTLSNSTATFRSILYEENEMRKFKRDHTITELDPCTSTRVEIPASLTEKLKSAKRFIKRHYICTLIYNMLTFLIPTICNYNHNTHHALFTHILVLIK